MCVSALKAHATITNEPCLYLAAKPLPPQIKRKMYLTFTSRYNSRAAKTLSPFEL